MKTLNLIALCAVSVFTSYTFAIASCSEQDAIEALALNMYHEARGESPDGKLMVGEVTLNRVESPRYPNTICEVVYQSMQFSWTHTQSDHTPYDEEMWQISLNIAEGLLDGSVETFETGATHFLNPDLVSNMPRWAHEFQVIGRVGNHVFYSDS